MSGHSKWSTIKRKKEATDAARGKLFSKLIKAITIAAKTGGGPNPDANPRLKVAIETARAANMPKGNIERALSKAESIGDLSEITYEGFGPGNVSILIDVATDNRNRTGQEIKQLLERAGGSLSGVNSVAFNFVPKGQIVAKLGADKENELLALIDAGVEYFEEGEEEVEIFVEPNATFETKQKLEASGLTVTSAELVQKPVNMMTVDAKTADKVFELLDTLENQEDVQKVYCNVDVN